MATMLILSLLAGVAWGILWSLLDGFCVRRNILVGSGPNMMLVGMLRSVITCVVSSIPVALVLGTTGGLLGMVLALVAKWTLERRF
jgi:hypothetical protein